MTRQMKPFISDQAQQNDFLNESDTLENKMQQQKDLLQAILDSSSSYISVQKCIRNELGAVIDFELGAINKPAKAFLENYHSAGKRFSEVFPEVIDSGLLKKMIETIETGIAQQFVIHYMDLWFQYSLSKLEDSIVCIAEDITVRRKAELEVLRLKEEQLRNNEERQAFLLELSDTIRTLSDPMDIQRQAAELLCKRLQADRAYYTEFDDDLSVATIYQEYKRKEDPSVIGSHPLKEIPLLIKCMQEGIPFLISNLKTAPGINPSARQLYSKLGICAVAIIPVVKNGHTIAAIVVVFHNIHEWTDMEVHIMQETIQRTWEAVERARTVTTLRKRENELARVQRIGRIAGVDIEIPNEVEEYISKPSPEYKLLHGLSSDIFQETYSDWLNRIYPEDREKVALALKRALTEKDFIYQSEYRIVRPCDGQIRWIYAIKDIQWNSEGKAVHLTGVHIDITERKAVEEALHRSEEKYLVKLEQEVEERTAKLKESNHLVHRITETMPDMVSIMKWPSRELTYTNQFPFTMHGFDSNVMRNMLMEERTRYIHPDDRTVLDQYYKSFLTLEEGDINLCDYRAVNDQNEWMWFRVRGKVFERDGDQQINSVINVIQNISDLKAAEEIVKEQLHFVNQIAITIPDMLTVMELDSYQIIYANTKPFIENGFNYEKLANASAEYKVQLIHPEDLQAVRDYFQNFKSYSDDQIQSLEYRAKTDSGEWLWFRVRGKIFKRDEKNVPVQCVNIVQNINALKEAEKELLEMQLHRQKEIMNAIIHAQEQERERIGEALHNGVAQLLYGIQTRLQLLNPVGEPEKKNLKDIQAILSDAIKDTRGISFELVPSVLMDHGVETALRSLIQKVVIEHLEVRLICNFKERLPEKIEFPIYRMMQELLNNIIKHSQAKVATLKISKSKGFLSLIVKDNGVGFNEKEIKGMHKGIGLQSVKNRIKLLDGTLKIQSTINKGTTVSIRLPI